MSDSFDSGIDSLGVDSNLALLGGVLAHSQGLGFVDVARHSELIVVGLVLLQDVQLVVVVEIELDSVEGMPEVRLVETVGKDSGWAFALAEGDC